MKTDQLKPLSDRPLVDPLTDDAAYTTGVFLDRIRRMTENPEVIKTGLLPEIIGFAMMYAKGPCKDSTDTQYFNELEQALTDAYWEWMK